MKARSRSAVALGAASVVALGVVLSLHRAPEASPARPRVAPRCDFTGAGELGYRFAVTPEVSQGAAAGGVALRADLRLRPLRAVPGQGWILSGRFDPRSDDQAFDDLRRPFLVRVDRACRFEEYAWPAGTTAHQAEAVRAAMRAFEVHLSDEGHDRWQSPHTDANGVFVAYYRTVAPGTADRGARLEADAGDYVQSAARDAPAHLRAWGLRAELDPRGHLTRRVTGHARYELSAGQRDALPVALRFTLERVEPPRGAAPPSSADGFAWRMPAREDVTAAQATPRPAARDGLSEMSVDDAYARLLALFDGHSDPGHERAFQHLRAWLRARPAGAMELWSLLRAGGVDARLHALAIMTLGEANTPESRRALITALHDAGASAMDRQRAAAALGTMRTPTPEALDALREAARAGGASEDDVITRGVAMRSLGPLAGDRVPAAISDDARGTIRAAVASDDPALRLAGIDAAGNSRSASLVPELRGALADPRETTRESAVHALRGMPRDAAQPLLAARLRDERSQPVRRELAMTLTENARGVYSPESVAAAAAALPDTPDPTVRVALLTLLGEASRANPPAREALVAWAPREPEAELLRVIGRYLTLAEMRDALRQRAAR